MVLPLRSAYRYDLDHALLAVIVVVVSLGIAKVAGAAVHAGAASHAGTSGSASIFVSITRVVVWAIGGLILLNSLGVAITPLLTALGVGGLAVALALQDTPGPSPSLARQLVRPVGREFGHVHDHPRSLP